MAKPMSNRILTFGAMVAVLMCGDRAGAEKTNIVNVTHSAPAIDGIITGDEWGEATTAGDFSLLRAGGSPSSEVIEWKALWDDTAIYILVTSDHSTWTGPTSGGINWSLDNINFYLDPNTDGEANIADDSKVDGYQVSLNQPPGLSSSAPTYTEAHVNTLWGSSWTPSGMAISQNNTAVGGVLELMIPWADFNATQGEGELVHTNAPIPGSSWLFNIGRNDGVNLPIWNYHPGQFFAQRPQGVITFSAPPPQDPVTAIISNDSTNGTLSISWESEEWQRYNLRSQTDLNAGGDPASWPSFGVYTNILATPPTNTVTIPLPSDQQRFFIIQH